MIRLNVSVKFRDGRTETFSNVSEDVAAYIEKICRCAGFDFVISGELKNPAFIERSEGNSFDCLSSCPKDNGCLTICAKCPELFGVLPRGERSPKAQETPRLSQLALNKLREKWM